MSLSIIAAVGRNGEIGINNKLPWSIPEDMKRFKEITSRHTVIMGRKTFESIGRPLPNRKNVIITNRKNFTAPEGCIVVDSVESAFQETVNDGEVFVIGGAKIYESMLPLVERMYITAVDKEFEADTYFPEFDQSEWKISWVSIGHRTESESPVNFSYIIYERIKK